MSGIDAKLFAYYATASVLATNDQVFGPGRFIYEIDTHRLKIGDGTTNYNVLPYIGGTVVRKSLADWIADENPVPVGIIAVAETAYTPPIVQFGNGSDTFWPESQSEIYPMIFYAQGTNTTEHADYMELAYGNSSPYRYNGSFYTRKRAHSFLVGQYTWDVGVQTLDGERLLTHGHQTSLQHYKQGKPGDGVIFYRHVFNNATEDFQYTYSSSSGYAGTPFATEVTMTVKLNGTTISTLTFAASANTGTFSSFSIEPSSGDILEILSNVPDASALADVSFYIAGAGRYFGSMGDT